MATRITTISITPSATTVAGTFTTADVSQTPDGKWSERNPISQAITPTAEGFTLSHDGQTFQFTVNEDLRSSIDDLLDEHFSKPQTAKAVTPRPTAKNPNPKTFWLAYADRTVPIVCTISNWVVRPGLRWYDKTADPHQVWLINRRAGTLAFQPRAEIKFVN